VEHVPEGGDLGAGGGGEEFSSEAGDDVVPVEAAGCGEGVGAVPDPLEAAEPSPGADGGGG
jgi:hypothetical protein